MQILAAAMWQTVVHLFMTNACRGSSSSSSRHRPQTPERYCQGWMQQGDTVKHRHRRARGFTGRVTMRAGEQAWGHRSFLWQGRVGRTERAEPVACCDGGQRTRGRPHLPVVLSSGVALARIVQAPSARAQDMGKGQRSQVQLMAFDVFQLLWQLQKGGPHGHIQAPVLLHDVVGHQAAAVRGIHLYSPSPRPQGLHPSGQFSRKALIRRRSPRGGPQSSAHGIW